MNIELIIRIVEAVSLLAIIFLALIVYYSIGQINYLCDRLDRRIDFIKKLEKEHRRIEEQKIALTRQAAEGIKKAIDKKTSLEIFDELVDEPLPDFPNDSKEDR